MPEVNTPDDGIEKVQGPTELKFIYHCKKSEQYNPKISYELKKYWPNISSRMTSDTSGGSIIIYSIQRDPSKPLKKSELNGIKHLQEQGVDLEVL